MDENAKMKMQYLGALNVLAETSLMLGGDADAEEMRERMERIFDDAQKVVPRLRWRRILQRFELELADEDEPDVWPTLGAG